MWICLSKTPDADRVIKINYARWLCGRFHNVWSSFQTPLNSIFKRLFWNSQANPLGIESSAQFVNIALRILQLEVFNRVLFQVPIWKRGFFNPMLLLHQNRLELLAPPFLSREKVASTNIINLLSPVFQTRINRILSQAVYSSAGNRRGK